MDRFSLVAVALEGFGEVNQGGDIGGVVKRTVVDGVTVVGSADAITVKVRGKDNGFRAGAGKKSENVIRGEVFGIDLDFAA